MFQQQFYQLIKYYICSRNLINLSSALMSYILLSLMPNVSCDDLVQWEIMWNCKYLTVQTVSPANNQTFLFDTIFNLMENIRVTHRDIGEYYNFQYNK